MKRSLLFVPFVLLFFLNACGTVGIGPEIETAVALTQIARTWTPTVTPLPDPSENKIVDWLNTELDAADELEQALDATYEVFDVMFLPQDSAQTTVRIYMRCKCSTYAGCCSPERMFVKTIDALKESQGKVLEHVPGSVNKMEVACYNQTTYLVVISASWPDVRSYLKDDINGLQFGSRVRRE